MTGTAVTAFLDRVKEWSARRADIQGVALVGSQARGTATEDSDIDLIIIATNPTRYIDDTAWLRSFGDISGTQLEDYGRVTSLRVWYGSGLEVEFGLTDASWISRPLDAGTRDVIAGGMRVILDPYGRLRNLRSSSGRWGDDYLFSQVVTL